jgi:mannose-6-phosphate isomerase-like protein (cupin superfamily)
MIIDFSKMDVTVLPNFKGGEKEFAANMFFDGTNRIFKGVLVPGATIGMHTHDDSCEVIFILEGNGTIVEMGPTVHDEAAVQEETVKPVSAGDCLYCPKGHSHSLRNTAAEGDLVFYAVVPKQ